jgi:hypothetical protein
MCRWHTPFNVKESQGGGLVDTKEGTREHVDRVLDFVFGLARYIDQRKSVVDRSDHERLEDLHH